MVMLLIVILISSLVFVTFRDMSFWIQNRLRKIN